MDEVLLFYANWNNILQWTSKHNFSDSANCFLIVLISCSKLLLKHSHQCLNFCVIVRFFSFSCRPYLYFLRTRSHSEGQEIFNSNVAICREKYTLKFSQGNSGNKNLDISGTKCWAIHLLCFWTSKIPCTVWISNTKTLLWKRINPCLYN